MKRTSLILALTLTLGTTIPAIHADTSIFRSHKSAESGRERTLTYITTMQASLRGVALPALEQHLGDALIAKQAGQSAAAITSLDKAAAILAETDAILAQIARDRATLFPDNGFLLRRENDLKKSLEDLRHAYTRQRHGLSI